MQNIYQTAIDVQDACNPSGVAISFVEVIRAIREEPGFNGTDDIRRHPAFIMFVSKFVAFANGIGEIPHVDFGKAYDICKEKAHAGSEAEAQA